MGESAVLPLTGYPSLRERIAERLREAILAGDLAAKARLKEPELARGLGVSRTPLREAIRQLEAEGLLTTVPRVGTFVSEVHARDAEETYAIRAVLEGLAARQAAENPDPSKAERLRDILSELARKTHDAQMYREAAGRFHELIFALSGNRRLQALNQSLNYQVNRLRALSLSAPRRPSVSLREHRQIAAAIVRGQGTDAERLTRAHVEGARVVIERRIRPGSTSGVRKRRKAHS
ncbi:MAG TPA: GntR family transcriptional regulator [Candidatus Sulfotelmatobacter sp.]|nr:GntR family transcriptional regulator [Candidatus Sulfotelmatobacter sp.]